MKKILLLISFFLIMSSLSGCIDDNSEKENDITKMPPAPPTITIISPTNDQQVSGSIEIIGVANEQDNRVNLTDVEYQIDSNPWINCDDVNLTYPGNWKIELNTLNLTDGDHVIRVRAVNDYYEPDQWQMDEIAIEVKNGN
jgi:Bacterial Ig domain